MFKVSDSNLNVIFTRRFEPCWLQFVLANGQIFKWVKKVFFFLRFVSNFELLRFLVSDFSKKKISI